VQSVVPWLSTRHLPRTGYSARANDDAVARSLSSGDGSGFRIGDSLPVYLKSLNAVGPPLGSSAKPPRGRGGRSGKRTAKTLSPGTGR